jgi:hypothetical protein
MTLAKLLDNFPAAAKKQPEAKPVATAQAVQPTQPEVKPAPITAVEDVCKTCQGKHFWQAKRSTVWRCFTCCPPPDSSMIADQRGGQAIAVARSTETTGRLVTHRDYHTRDNLRCVHCHGAMVCQISFQDLTGETRCATCDTKLETQLF